MNYSPGKPPADYKPVFEANGGSRKESAQDFRDRFYIRVDLEDKRAARQLIGSADEERNVHDKVFFVFYDDSKRDAAVAALAGAGIASKSGQDVQPELVGAPEPNSKPDAVAPQSAMKKAITQPREQLSLFKSD